MNKNIVLIGLTGCGKTTVGTALSYRLRMPFVDMDAYIERQEGKTVSEIFKEKGEAYFRRAEARAAKTLSRTGGKIIATGGGVVLHAQNMHYLKKTGVVLFLDRSPDAILKKINLKKRPLLAADKNHLFQLDRERRPLYEKYADITVPGLSRVSQTVESAVAALTPFLPDTVCKKRLWHRRPGWPGKGPTGRQ